MTRPAQPERSTGDPDRYCPAAVRQGNSRRARRPLTASLIEVPYLFVHSGRAETVARPSLLVVRATFRADDAETRRPRHRTSVEGEQR